MGAVYFDHNATTPLEPRVREAMLPWMGELHGNPSSVHSFGRAAREAVEEARDRVASMLDVAPVEVVFTSSGTEANNAVLLALASGVEERGHVVISAFEHPSVEASAVSLEQAGLAVTRVPPSPAGLVEAPAVVAALRPDTRLVALMLANNEVGTLQPVAEVAAQCRDRRVLVLCDAVQAVGKIPVTAPDLEVDYLVIGAHKFYGPAGAAALCIRGGAPFVPLLVGGGQERQRRASTLNVPAIVGMGAACDLVDHELDSWMAHQAEVRDRFEQGLPAIADTIVHGRGTPRLPNTSHVAFLGTQAESLLIRLDLAGFAVSTGSACSSGAVEPSTAMKAMGVEHEEAIASLRFSFGKDTEPAQVDAFLEVLAREVASLRSVAESRTGIR